MSADVVIYDQEHDTILELFITFVDSEWPFLVLQMVDTDSNSVLRVQIDDTETLDFLISKLTEFRNSQ